MTLIQAIRDLLYTGDEQFSASHPMSLPISRRITRKTIVRVLIFGFSLVIVLLVAGSVVAVQNTRSIHHEAEQLVAEQALTAQMINEIQVEQSTINAVFNQLTRDPESADRQELLRQLHTSDKSLAHVVQMAAQTPEATLWNRWAQAAQDFAAEAERVLAFEQITDSSLYGLVNRHDEVRRLVADLVNATSKRAALAEEQITSESANLMRQSGGFLGLAALLAFVCAVFTVKVTIELFQRMETQAGELSRVSWHMLQSQEATARRFSHELHDELGQCLTALKANVSALVPENLNARRKDCTMLVDEAIANVRELSQLLRPVILDDFGLEPSLRWLAEKFTQRTGIAVHVQSSFSERLADSTETHLFRIAQEALTNTARHSGATEVHITLACTNDRVELSIRDNGSGMPQGMPSGRKTSLGVVGMRARARDAGGELAIESAKGGGVTITAVVPAHRHTVDAEQEDAHSVGR